MQTPESSQTTFQPVLEVESKLDNRRGHQEMRERSVPDRNMPTCEEGVMKKKGLKLPTKEGIAAGSNE